MKSFTEEKAIHPQMYRRAVEELAKEGKTDNPDLYQMKLKDRYRELCDRFIGDRLYFYY